jgi:ArsR family transcriptional regulator, arsenate/arsenite/antimonite-responsive transcriptional repressor
MSVDVHAATTMPVDAAANAFAALSDPVRLRLFLMVAGRLDEVCACELIEPSGRSQPTVSHHMKVLVEAGLVQRTKRGQWVWYRADPERLSSLSALLDAHDC